VAFRPFVLAAICGLVVSGAYNILTHPGHRPPYHVLLGIKLLLALHVFAVTLLIARPGHPRRAAAMMTGVRISGLAIIAIAAYLQHIFSIAISPRPAGSFLIPIPAIGSPATWWRC
jgi:hypothetical protein